MILSRLEGFYNFLKADPIGFIIFVLYFSAALIISLVIHEYAHGYVAYKCGDTTAKILGRLTLNPLKHLDPLGTIFMVLFGFGWAKPVPINSRNFNNRVKDDFYVSIAGIICNLTLYLISTSIMIAINRFVWKPEVLENISYFNLLYSGSYGASYILSSAYMGNDLLIANMTMAHILRFFMLLSQFNLILAIFNAMPIPPLDGFHIMNNLIFKGKISMNAKLMKSMQIILFILILYGAFNKILLYLTNSIEIGVLRTFLQIVGRVWVNLM